MPDEADWLTECAMDPDCDDPRDDQDWCDRCEGEGEVPTADHESYLGAMMKPCPKCHRVVGGTGHGKLS